jgi:hypothetical protein
MFIKQVSAYAPCEWGFGRGVDAQSTHSGDKPCTQKIKVSSRSKGEEALWVYESRFYRDF